MQAQQTDDTIAQSSHDVWQVPRAHLRVIFKGHIAHPITVALDAPVVTDQLQQLGCICAPAQNDKPLISLYGVLRTSTVENMRPGE